MFHLDTHKLSVTSFVLAIVGTVSIAVVTIVVSLSRPIDMPTDVEMTRHDESASDKASTEEHMRKLDAYLASDSSKTYEERALALEAFKRAVGSSESEASSWSEREKLQLLDSFIKRS